MNKDNHVEPKTLGGIIPITYDTGTPTVRGLDLHKALKIKTRYNNWFPRMCAFGFYEGRDYVTVVKKSTGGRPPIDHLIFITMAKELCMLQRSEMGREFRRYFLSINEDWNNPEKIMERAQHIARENARKADQRIITRLFAENKESHHEF